MYFTMMITEYHRFYFSPIQKNECSVKGGSGRNRTDISSILTQYLYRFRQEVETLELCMPGNICAFEKVATTSLERVPCHRCTSRVDVLCHQAWPKLYGKQFKKMIPEKWCIEYKANTSNQATKIEIFQKLLRFTRKKKLQACYQEMGHLPETRASGRGAHVEGTTKHATKTAKGAENQHRKEELNRQVNKGVIIQIDHSEWPCRIVFIHKPNGRVKICYDFQDGLNSLINIEQYRFPTIDDLL
ncbi:hypothetical protein RF11_15178 [Thelohanellus kitauei]|uniref:Uncharacterized protein n=1 Tax=Thelohanellus kitauei TaxID=669202 RepID=A0A0C2N8N5_THEKT|nr:hypothetical protein RF11_15178 [Thelohanellus kitauei]